MKVSDFVGYINKAAFYRLQSGISFEIVVIDVKPSDYGRVRFQIRPKDGAGSGSCWVNDSSITISNKFVNQ